MTLASLLSRNREVLLEAWLGRVLDTYPATAAARLRREEDPFQNPVGSTLKDGLARILDGILSGADAAALSPPLDALMHVRAIEAHRPSEAVGFLLELKDVLRQGGPGTGSPEETRRLEEAVDRVALLGFDLYCACREKVFDIRVHEIRNQTRWALQRAGIVARDPVPPVGSPRREETERGRQT